MKLGISDIALLVDYMNMEPKLSAQHVLDFSDSLHSGAVVIMTVKCVTRKIDKYIRQVEGVLGGKFEIKGVKVLPSNRQEATLYAVRK